MEYIGIAIIFLFGAALGSFVAVIVNRYNTGLSFLKGQSVCFSCNTQLSKRDLIPIFSFLFLRGKCRYCKSKIPKETIITEILMAIFSLLAAFKSGLLGSNFSFSLTTIFSGGGLLLIVKYLLTVFIFGNILLIALYDLRHFIIPDSFLVFFFIFSFIYLSVFLFFNFSFLPYSFLFAIILALPFFFIFLISKGTWFGFGDVKYIGVLGFFLGLSQGLSAVILAFWIGAVFSLLAISLKRLAPHINLPLLKNNLTIKSEIPFGPFLSLGIIISFCLSADLFQTHSLLNLWAIN